MDDATTLQHSGYKPPRWIVSDDGCWVWQLARDHYGHGRINVRGRFVGAHRWVYEQLVGPVPVGRELDHLCRNPACVNPAHLEPVTHTENCRRGAKYGGAETCGKGHHDFVRSRSGKRYCRTCNREYAKAG